MAVEPERTGQVHRDEFAKLVDRALELLTEATVLLSQLWSAAVSDRRSTQDERDRLVRAARLARAAAGALDRDTVI